MKEEEQREEGEQREEDKKKGKKKTKRQERKQQWKEKVQDHSKAAKLITLDIAQEAYTLVSSSDATQSRVRTVIVWLSNRTWGQYVKMIEK